MIKDFFVTKQTMCQAWTKQGRRLAVTQVFAPDLMIINQRQIDQNQLMLEVGFGKKKLKNMTQPLQKQIRKGGFLIGAKQIKGIVATISASEKAPQSGQTIPVTDVLTVGDVVDVQGVTKGRGFAGAVKRYGFAGGPKTHGQSDRTRAVGSIGAGTYPGHVWKGKRMPGHYGVETKTIRGLVVLYIDPKHHQIWLNGPLPGSFRSLLRIRKTGQTRLIDLNREASGLPQESKDNVLSSQKDLPQESKDNVPSSQKDLPQESKDNASSSQKEEETKLSHDEVAVKVDSPATKKEK